MRERGKKLGTLSRAERVIKRAGSGSGKPAGGPAESGTEPAAQAWVHRPARGESEAQAQPGARRESSDSVDRPPGGNDCRRR